MKCANHPQNEAISACTGCAKPLCAACGNAAGRCAVCAAKAAAEDIQRDDRERIAAMAARAARGRRMARLRSAALWILLILSTAAALWRLPAAVHSLDENKPLRIGTYATDAQTDACIATLWRVSQMLQEGKTRGATLTCPASGLPYAPRVTADGVVYHCPQPGRHGLKALEISRMNPVPEVRK